jgi:hypothetical protein
VAAVLDMALLLGQELQAKVIPVVMTPLLQTMAQAAGVALVLLA